MISVNRSSQVAVLVETPDGPRELVTGTLAYIEVDSDHVNGNTYTIQLTDYTPHRKEQTTMTTKQYTAEDFANAEFARHPDGATAARFDDGDGMPWRATTGRWLSDRNLAEQGWEPAYVSRNPQKMRRHVSDLEAVVKRRGEDIARLEAEKAELRKRVAQAAAQPITLDSLHEAWGGRRGRGRVQRGRHSDPSTSG